MKRLIALVILPVTLSLFSTQAATPAQEKAFIDSYKKALEAGDQKALTAFLYTKGAQPDEIEFAMMMQTMSSGGKITNIELVTPSAADAAKFNEPMTMPNGKAFVLNLKPTKQLVIASETKNANESSKGTSKVPVAEKDGKLVIPVPVAAKKK